MKDSRPGKFIYQVEPYITDNERKAVAAYMESGGWLTEHEKTREFEKRIAEFVDARYATVVTSGTVALYLALLACGVKGGQSVVVPDYTMIATPNSAKWAGAEVILADVQRTTLCLDIDEVKLEPNTRALIYVSMNGRADRVDELVEFCQNKGITLVEDAAQAFGSRWNGKCLGTFGEVGVFSFTPHKIITTGQGGAVVTNNVEIHDRIQKLKDFCRTAPGVDVHTDIGFNFKFTDLQAVVGIEQLKAIDFRVMRRRDIYKRYMEELEDFGPIEVLHTDLTEVVPWFADILLRVPRDRVIDSLRDRSIGCRPFYPPVHTQLPYRSSAQRFVVSSEVCPRGLWLPSSIGISDEEISHVVDSLKDVLGS